MFKKTEKQQPTVEQARAYVRRGIYGKGGWAEAIGGLIHKSIPSAIGTLSSVTFASVLALLLRVCIVILTALFPLLVRRVSSVTSAAHPNMTDGSIAGGVGFVLDAVAGATSVDVVLGLIALLVVGLPKLLDALGKQAKIGHHSPFFDLTAAIKKLPIQNPLQAQATDDAIRLTLLALREEMALLIGDASGQRVTDVTLLEFCDAQGNQMQVRSRTANHDEVRRPVDSKKFVAYYVALEGRSFAEHDFTKSGNPFPPKRITVWGSPDVDYRSVLYMPIVCSQKTEPPQGQHGVLQVIDSCAGVICVHSSKPYRFWRWGDHKKGVGGFADVAFSRSMPYIAIIEQLLSRTAPRVGLEAK